MEHFLLLYFGVNWRTEQPQGMVVDIWDGLPTPQVEMVKSESPPIPQVGPSKQVEPPKLAEPVSQPKPDIAMPEKNMPKIKPHEPVKAIETKPVPMKRTEPQLDQKAQEAQAAQAEQDRARTAQVAAIGKMVDELSYQDHCQDTP